LKKEGVRRCPLCHVVILDGETGWKVHLLEGNGCPGSSRRPRIVKRELSPSSSKSQSPIRRNGNQSNDSPTRSTPIEEKDNELDRSEEDRTPVPSMPKKPSNVRQTSPSKLPTPARRG